MNENDTSWGHREMPYIWVKVVMGSVRSNHDPLDGLDSNSNDSQYSLQSFLSGCGATEWQKEVKRPTSIIVRGSSSRKFGRKTSFHLLPQSPHNLDIEWLMYSSKLLSQLVYTYSQSGLIVDWLLSPGVPYIGHESLHCDLDGHGVNQWPRSLHWKCKRSSLQKIRC